MKEKSKKNKDYENANKNLERCLDRMANAYSSCDCTGLIPRNPENNSELKSYNEVYNYLPTETEGL